MNTICRFPSTSVALPLAFLVLAAAVFADISSFDLPGIAVIGIEPNETDVVVLAFLLVVPSFLIDRAVTRQRAYQSQLQAEQLRVLHMTMRTVQDIVGNALMSMYLFRAEAEPNVSLSALAQFDHIISDTAERLKAISDLKIVSETRMSAGMGIEYQTGPSR
jgi:hypothetical protein